MNSSPRIALPRIIALCGNPLSGKSTAAEIIHEMFGYRLADDGLALRRIAVDYFGLTERQVFTQEGKLEKVMLGGREWTVREILGEIGNALEDRFGADIIPIMAHCAQPKDAYCVFGSVRREQGRYWREQGALVIEIRNPLAGPSPYEFDRYNPEHVHVSVDNDGLALGMTPEQARIDLRNKLITAINAHVEIR